MILPAVLLVAALGAEPSPNAGSVVVAKAAGDAIVIWDSSGDIAELRSRKLANDDILHALESRAILLAAARAAKLTAATTVSIRVVYPRKAEFNPQYGVQLSTTVERLATLKAPRAVLLNSAERWSHDLEAGKKPDGLTIDVTGELPPPA